MKIAKLIPTKANQVERLESELAALTDEAGALAKKIESLTVREGEVEDAGEMIRALADSRAAQNKLRRLDGEIADCREKLATARDAMRAKLRAELLANFTAAAGDFITKARAAQEATSRAIAAREAFQDAGFDTDYRTAPFLPSVNGAALLAPDLLDNFEAALNPARAAPVAKLKAVAAPRPAPPPVLGRINGQGAVRLDERSAPPPPKRAVHADSAIDGEVLVIVLRDGVEHPTKGALIVGDVVSFPRDQATEMARNGAIDFAPVPEPETLSGKDEQVAQIDAGNGTAEPQPEEETK